MKALETPSDSNLIVLGRKSIFNGIKLNGCATQSIFYLDSNLHWVLMIAISIAICHVITDLINFGVNNKISFNSQWNVLY
jgi:phage-related holin